jgi:hypothetical protein
MPPPVIASSGDRHRTMEKSMTYASPSFTQEEVDLLEYAVYTAYRKDYHEHADSEHLQRLRQLQEKLIPCVSDEHYLAVS